MAAKSGAAAEAATEQETQKAADDLAKKVADELAKKFDFANLKSVLAETLKGMGVKENEITDDLIFTTFQALPAEKKDEMLRKVGLVPTPGFFSSISGWHNVEHLRSRGWRNKVAGGVGLIYQGAAIGLATYMGVNWYRSRGASA